MLARADAARRRASQSLVGLRDPHRLRHGGRRIAAGRAVISIHRRLQPPTVLIESDALRPLCPAQTGYYFQVASQKARAALPCLRFCCR